MYHQVAELYEMMKKWDNVANTVPHVVDRLVALQELHEQGTYMCLVMIFSFAGRMLLCVES